jgi:hypothetical protein
MFYKNPVFYFKGKNLYIQVLSRIDHLKKELSHLNPEIVKDNTIYAEEYELSSEGS